MTRILATLCAVLFLAAPGLAQQPNHLVGARSPYLLQHLHNPVDWYQWGPDALDKARAEGKPIFVSVGYSACHWCHVMREESFEDPDIAAYLNAHFVSIKIDRESRPDLDEQFMLVTQALTGTGGWPNSVFLTPEGDPFFAGGYFPPRDFTELLAQVQAAWAEDPELIRAEAWNVAQAVGGYLTRRAEAREITPELAAAAAASVLPQVDEFNGGIGVAPKFPRETLFLFLLDQAERSGDRDLLQVVTDMLDAMIAGGIHDHVGGGFHRYAVDPNWHVPHFEKMLYTQALTGRLLIRAWSATGAEQYRRAAQRVFAHVMRDMRAPSGAFYSALDADSQTATGEKAEGAFYMWSPDQLTPLGHGAARIAELFAVDEIGDLDGANVLHLAEPLERLLQGREQLHVYAALERMRQLRDARPAPARDSKIVLSWNAAMIETLAEASHRLHPRPNDYYDQAATAARFLLDHLRGPDGLLRVSYDGQPDIPAQLPDYAGLGLALLALHDYAPDADTAAHWRAEAETLAAEMHALFAIPEGGYAMTRSGDGFSRIIPVEDGDLPSGNAMALALLTRLGHRAHLPEAEQEAWRLAAALSGHAAGAPGRYGSALTAIQDLQFGETGPVRYAAKGHVRAELRLDRNSGAVRVHIAIADGWHINAKQPLEDYFVATTLTVADQPVTYPEPLVKSLSFNDAPLALYEGKITLTASAPSAATIANLILQACSDEICLQPEDLRFTLW